MTTFFFSRRLRQLVWQLAVLPASFILNQTSAKADLNINIYDDGPNLQILVTGSLSALGTSRGQDFSCGGQGALTESPRSVICSGGTLGVNDSVTSYFISGPVGFGSTASLSGLADYLSGLSFALVAEDGDDAGYGISSSYILGQPFLSSATFNNTSLASQGFTTSGLVATWTINGTSESINLFIDPPAEVPGPLPLLGAGAAFGWSRRLRRRMTTSVITPSQD
jgi:hypothetical protein